MNKLVVLPRTERSVIVARFSVSLKLVFHQSTCNFAQSSFYVNISYEYMYIHVLRTTRQ